MTYMKRGNRDFMKLLVRLQATQNWGSCEDLIMEDLKGRTNLSVKL